MELISEDKRSNINRDITFLAVVLECTILQLRILDSCCKLRCVQRTLKDGVQSKDSQTKKLFKDRSRLSEICQKTLVEIINSNSWQVLDRAVEILSKDLTIKDVLNSYHIQLLRTQEQAINELVESRSQFELKLRETNERIAFLKDHLEDAVINTGAMLIYSEKWLDGRSEILFKDNYITLRRYLPNLDHEQRVHDELIKAYEIQTKELEGNVEHWQIKYAEDIVEIKNAVMEKKEQLNITTARREELQKHYNLHEGEMRAWLTFKKERAARRAREERARLSATKIQAWWRGNMVRRGLGVFRYLRNVKKTPAKTKKKS